MIGSGDDVINDDCGDDEDLKEKENNRIKWVPFYAGDSEENNKKEQKTTKTKQQLSLLFSDDDDSEQEEKRRRDARRRHAKHIAPDDEEELRLRERVKKCIHFSLLLVKFSSQDTKHKGNGVITSERIGPMQEIVREYVKIEINGEFESLECAKVTLTEKALEVDARNAYLSRDEENKRKKTSKNNEKTVIAEEEIKDDDDDDDKDDDDKDSISSETWTKAEERVEKFAIGQVRKILKPTQFGGVEKDCMYVHYKLLGTHKVSEFFNHSCYPNCAVSYTVNNACSIYTLRDISPNEELTINYSGPILTWLPVDIRRNVLKRQFGFECHCLRCEDEAKILLTSKISTMAKPPTDPRWFYMPCSTETGFEKLFDFKSGELSIDATVLRNEHLLNNSNKFKKRNGHHSRNKSDQESSDDSADTSSMYEEDDDDSFSSDEEFSHDSDESDTSASECDELLRWNESRRTKYSRRYKFAKFALAQKALTPIQLYRFMRKAYMRDDHWQVFVTREVVLDFVRDCETNNRGDASTMIDGVELFKLLLTHCRSSMRIFPNSPHFAKMFNTLETMYQLNKKTLNANLSKRWKFRLEVVREAVHPDLLHWNIAQVGTGTQFAD